MENSTTIMEGVLSRSHTTTTTVSFPRLCLTVLLEQPQLIANSWLALASAIWFFLMPQPPKPSMLEVVEASWQPNSEDLSSNLLPGFGLTTNIINGGVECNKETELQQ